MQILTQIIGIIAMVFGVLSFQSKKNTNFFIMQGIANCLFFAHFLMLGQPAGAFMNLLGLFRSVCLNVKKLKNTVTEVLFIACFIAVAVIFYENLLTILILIAQLVGTVVFWLDNGKVIRICQLTISSPAWLTHNIINFSIGGIITEIFNIVSTVISLVRFRKSGFESNDI